MDLKNFGITFVGIIIGGFLAQWTQGILPFALDGWMLGIYVGIVDMIVLVFLGVIGHFDIVSILIGGAVIFGMSILGGFATDFLDFSGMYATLLIAAVQTAGLMLTGFVKGAKPIVPIAGKTK